jgi:hypothetical protein
MSKMCPITKSVVLYTECIECDTKECRNNSCTSSDRMCDNKPIVVINQYADKIENIDRAEHLEI